MAPVTIPLNPAHTMTENHGHYVQITEDENFDQKVKPWNFLTVIPATGITQVWLVLEENGKEVWEQYGNHAKRVASELCFLTVGTDYDDWIEEQRKQAEDAANAAAEDDGDQGCYGGIFAWFFTSSAFQHRVEESTGRRSRTSNLHRDAAGGRGTATGRLLVRDGQAEDAEAREGAWPEQTTAEGESQ